MQTNAITYTSANGANYAIKQASCPPLLYAKRLKSGVYQEQEDGLHKRCSKCREYWPADSEFFYTQRADDGLNDWRKACYREWRAPQKAAIKPTATKESA